MTSAQIAKLSVPQRITLAEEIWDSVAKDQGVLDVDDAEREYVESRLASIDLGKEKLVNWEVLKKQARSRRK